jgi:hypothetical protein
MKQTLVKRLKLAIVVKKFAHGLKRFSFEKHYTCGTV